MKLQFRTAAFGGFHKQDVMAYLTASSREHAEKLAALQRELEEEKAARAGLEGRAADLEQRVRTLTEENQRLAADLTQREAELNQASAQRDAFAAEVGRLREKTEKLEPAAAAYEAIKERAAAIELEAHSRALAIEGEARQKSRKIAEEMDAWLLNFQAAYDRLRAGTDAALGRAAEELRRSEGELGKLAEEFSGQDEALRALRGKMEALNGPQPPAPLPAGDDGE